MFTVSWNGHLETKLVTTGVEKKNDRKFQICNREIFYKFYVGRLKDFKYLNETMGWNFAQSFDFLLSTANF